MKYQSEIDRASSQIFILEEKAANLGVEAYELRKLRDDLIARSIIEDKMLSDSTWEIQSAGATSYLEFTGEYEGGIKKVREMARKDYHYDFEIQDGISLRFDDNEMSLHFEDLNMILPFAKKNNLQLSGSKIMDRLGKLKREVAALETLVHQFNL